MFSLFLLVITVGIYLTTYLFLTKREYSLLVIVLTLQIILMIIIVIDTEYNLYSLIQVETIKLETLDKLVQEVDTMKKSASSYEERQIFLREEEKYRDWLHYGASVIVGAALIAMITLQK